MNRVSLLLGVFLWAATLPAQEEFRLKHPLPDYSVYSDFEITAIANRVRASRPQILRGGWEWDRLLRRYIDEGRSEAGALEVLHGYFMSILDRYDEAVRSGKGASLTCCRGTRLGAPPGG